MTSSLRTSCKLMSVITRSQSQAAERENDLILSATPQQADAKHSSRKGAKPDLASKPISAAKDCIDIPMSDMPELLLAHAFVTHKFPVTLLVHYNPAGMPTDSKGRYDSNSCEGTEADT